MNKKAFLEHLLSNYPELSHFFTRFTNAIGYPLYKELIINDLIHYSTTLATTPLVKGIGKNIRDALGKYFKSKEPTKTKIKESIRHLRNIPDYIVKEYDKLIEDPFGYFTGRKKKEKN